MSRALIDVAIDTPNRAEAVTLLDRLPALRTAKIGSILFSAEGCGDFEECKNGTECFLDLSSDIPELIWRGDQRVPINAVSMLTIHTSGGGMTAMIKAARSDRPSADTTDNQKLWQ